MRHEQYGQWLAAAALGAAALSASIPGCVGTTGSDLVTFRAAAAGPADATEGAPYVFAAGAGYTVTLTKATLHIGALYLNVARAVSGAQATDCVLPGTYVGEVTAGLDVDVLSPEPQLFPGGGEGTETDAFVGEVWLNHGDVDDPDDADPVLTVEGRAEKDGITYPFQGTLTIGENRLPATDDPSQPSQHPMCKQRIVSPIPVRVTPKQGGSLLVRIDPKGWFTNVNFSLLTKVSDSPLAYQFGDDGANQPDTNLYRGIHATTGVYQWTWVDSKTP